MALGQRQQLAENHAVRQCLPESLGTFLGNLGFLEAQQSEFGQPFQVLQASVGDLGVAEVQALVEVGQFYEVL